MKINIFQKTFFFVILSSVVSVSALANDSLSQLTGRYALSQQDGGADQGAVPISCSANLNITTPSNDILQVSQDGPDDFITNACENWGQITLGNCSNNISHSSMTSSFENGVLNYTAIHVIEGVFDRVKFKGSLQMSDDKTLIVNVSRYSPRFGILLKDATLNCVYSRQ